MVYREEVVAFSEQEQAQAEPSSEGQDKDISNVNEDEELEVFIPKGSTSEDIAQILKDNGVIENTEEFLELIARKQLSSKLKAGMFLFPKEVTLDELITLLTD